MRTITANPTSHRYITAHLVCTWIWRNSNTKRSSKPILEFHISRRFPLRHFRNEFPHWLIDQLKESWHSVISKARRKLKSPNSLIVHYSVKINRSNVLIVTQEITHETYTLFDNFIMVAAPYYISCTTTAGP